MALTRIWLSPVEMQVLSGTHRFQVVPFATEHVPPGVRDDDAKTLFFNGTKDMSVALPDLVSGSASTSWYSPTPQMFIGHVADMSLWRHLVRRNELQLGEKSWLSVLLKGVRMCVRHSSHDRWYLAIASYSGVAAVGWPMQEIRIGAHTFYGLAAQLSWSDTPFLHIVNLSEWRAFSFEWAGPLHVKLMTKENQGSTRLFAVPDGAPGALLKICARKARHDCGVNGPVALRLCHFR